MASSATATCTKSARVATTTGFDAGAGASLYIPAGTYSGYLYRGLFGGYGINSAWWTARGATKLVSARAYFRQSPQNYVQRGSDPDTTLWRLTADFTEGTAVALSSSNAVVYGTQPAHTATNAVNLAGLASNNDVWISQDISAMVEDILPSFVMKRDGVTPGAGSGTFYGIKTNAASTTAADINEFYSDDTSSKPYIVVTYETNRAPNAPTLQYPIGGQRIAETNPSFYYAHSDPDGNNSQSGNVQVATDSGMTAIVTDNTVNVVVANGGQIIHSPGFTGTRGTTYYWRARTKDSVGVWGPFSAVMSFVIDNAPTATKVRPTASQFAYIWNLGDLAVWDGTTAYAKARHEWSFADVDGGVQTAYQVRRYDAAVAGSLVYDSGKVMSAATYHDATTAIVLGTERWWTIEVWDDLDVSSGESSRTAFKMRFGQAIYEHNPGTGSSNWNVTAGAITDGEAAFGYAGATGASGVGRGSWQSAVGSIAPATYGWVNILVRLQPNSAPGTTPTLADLTLRYLGSASVPDKWTLWGDANAMGLDSSVKRYGTKSMKYTAGNWGLVFPYRKTSGDDIPVTPGQVRTVSVYLKTLGAHHGMRIEVLKGLTADQYIAVTAAVTDSSGAPDGWQRLTTTYTVPAGVAYVRVQLAQGPGSVPGEVTWIDGVRDEEGTVATTWTPGFIGDPVVLDAGGIAVDGSAGGIFRAKGSAGAARDTFELGPHGLLFSDVEFWSPAAETMQIGDGLNSQFLIIEGPASGTEGGELILAGAGSWPDWHVDVSSDKLRFFDTAERLGIKGTTPHVQVTGDEAVSGTLAVTGAASAAGIDSSASIKRGGLDTFPVMAAPVDIVASANITLTTTAQDVTGATTTFTPAVAEVVLVTAFWDWDVTVTPTSSTICVGELFVDGVAQTPEALMQVDTAAGSANQRATHGQTWVVALTAAAHTLKLSSRKTANFGTIVANAPHTKMTIARFRSVA